MSVANRSQTSRVCVAVDAMGGDFAPKEILAGVLDALAYLPVEVILVGPESQLVTALDGMNPAWRNLAVQIIHTDEVIAMDESPITAMRKKKNASILLTAELVAKARAQAMVAAGSTGAAMASALFKIGRQPGVDRPAIGVVLPTPKSPSLLLDAGANAEGTPEMLQQFARMGSVFMQAVYSSTLPQARPRVGLMNIGEERGKGHALAHATFEALQQDDSIYFTGNAEGRDLFSGNFDVVVCDGFTGNVALKSAEGLAKTLGGFIKQELNRSLTSKLGAFFAQAALRRAKDKLDPEEFGGALLLGINGVCVISHGSSKARGIYNAIRVAKEAVEADMIGKTTQALSQAV
ncbi:MAG: phosphate acyltransferase PlsX [Vampirovibrionales bacterium]|nr:phosphate acyltransferase PlsX [Vampirovibrionales bacterium]